MLKGENSIKMTIQLLIQNGLYSQIGWHEYGRTTENIKSIKRNIKWFLDGLVNAIKKKSLPFV